MIPFFSPWYDQPFSLSILITSNEKPIAPLCPSPEASTPECKASNSERLRPWPRMLPKTEPPQRPPALLRRDPGRPWIPQSPIVPSIPANALTEFGRSSGSSWWTPRNPSGSSKSCSPFCAPPLGLQCDDHSQWVKFRTVVGEWQARFSANAQRLLVYWHVRDLVAETSQQLGLEEGCRRLIQRMINADKQLQ